MQTGEADLVGVWRLLSYHDLPEGEGPREGPLGPSPRGLLIYGADGFMSVSMMRTDGVPAGVVGGHRPGDRPVETFMGYAGRWRLVAPGTVAHSVEVSAHPSMVGTEQLRDAVLDSDRLMLYGTAVLSARPLRRLLTWRRS